MITRRDIEKLQNKVNRKAIIVGRTNNALTRKDFDTAIENLIKAEKEYNEQRRTKEIKYSISVRPIGRYDTRVTVWEDATQEEIEQAILDDCKFSLSFF